MSCHVKILELCFNSIRSSLLHHSSSSSFIPSIHHSSSSSSVIIIIISIFIYQKNQAGKKNHSTLSPLSLKYTTMPASNDESSRLQNTTAALPLAYGTIAFYQGPAPDEYLTHKWTLYLRSPDPDFDLSKAIRKVIFQLHPSFSVPTRELTEPPFEVTESGWGEFEASMRVEWREEAEERSTIVSCFISYDGFEDVCFFLCKTARPQRL